MDQEFIRKTVMVTGASKGIGAGIARAFGAAGAQVAVAYGHDRDRAERVAADIESAGGRALILQGDLRQAPDIESMIARVVTEFGPLQVLVNNAGYFDYKSLSDITATHFHDTFDTNVLGVLMTTKLAVANFDPAGGSVINISSLSAQGNAPGRAVYAASKAAVNAITKVLALELADRRIRVNGIMPGYFDTEGARAFGIQGSEQEAQLLAATPLDRRAGEPSEIASVALFLASRASNWMTGDILTVSGGLRG